MERERGGMKSILGMSHAQDRCVMGVSQWLKVFNISWFWQNSCWHCFNLKASSSFCLTILFIPRPNFQSMCLPNDNISSCHGLWAIFSFASAPWNPKILSPKPQWSSIVYDHTRIALSLHLSCRMRNRDVCVFEISCQNCFCNWLRLMFVWRRNV